MIWSCVQECFATAWGPFGWLLVCKSPLPFCMGHHFCVCIHRQWIQDVASWLSRAIDCNTEAEPCKGDSGSWFTHMHVSSQQSHSQCLSGLPCNGLGPRLPACHKCPALPLPSVLPLPVDSALPCSGAGNSVPAARAVCNSPTAPAEADAAGHAGP